MWEWQTSSIKTYQHASGVRDEGVKEGSEGRSEGKEHKMPTLLNKIVGFIHAVRVTENRCEVCVYRHLQFSVLEFCAPPLPLFFRYALLHTHIL